MVRPAPSRRPRWRAFATALGVVATSVATVLASPSGAQAVTLPEGFTHTTVATGLNYPTSMAFAPDGRIFVNEKNGRIRVIKNGVLLGTPFAQVSVDASGERGMSGVAVDPDFATNGYVYAYYTTSSEPVHNRLVRFTAAGDVARTTGGVVDMEVLADFPDLGSGKIHMSGAIHFGPDGKLYVSVGDAARAANSQTLSNVFGKLLRFNRDGSIPTDNPFYDRTTGLSRAIWALGLRNPFTFSFEHGTSRMRINDVGQETWEEVNDGVAGANYGWPTTEGPTTDPAFQGPAFAYRHSDAPVTGCAVTGGLFLTHPASTFPSSYDGDYLFADFCDHWIKRIDRETGEVHDFVDDASPHVVDLRYGPDGNVYYLSFGNGSVVRIGATASRAPAIGDQPADVVAAVGESATFAVSATGSGLSYQWRRNGAPISGATASAYTVAPVQASDGGDTFSVTVSNDAGSVTSDAATLTITDNDRPGITFTTPESGATYAGGDVVPFAATASDPEDGDLPPTAFTWRVEFNHDTHFHPFVPEFSGTREGEFAASRGGHTEHNVWYRVHLRVTDSAGRSTSTFRDVLPRKVAVTLATSPSGLSVNLDGQPRVTPVSITGVTGVERTLSAPLTQTKSGTTYEFAGWSDGGAANHTVVTPDVDTTYTATYRAVAAPAVLTPLADSYANEGAKSSNFGTSATLTARQTAPGQQSFLRYALPRAPEGSVLTGATLRLRTTTASSAGSADRVYVRTAGDGWTEGGLTWNNKPTVSPDNLGSVAPGSVPNATYTAVLDPALLRPLLGSQRTFALVTQGGDNVHVWSRNYSTVAHRPTLTLTFGASDEAPPPVDDTAPTTPTLLAPTVSGSTVSLAWQESTDGVGVTGYDVHRSTTSGFTAAAGNRVATVTGTAFSQSGLAAGTYHYRVVAKDAAGNLSPASAQVSATVAATSTTPTVVTLAPTADAFANQGATSKNYGSSASLAVRATSPGQVSYLRFTLPSAPAGKTLTGVSLRLRTSTESFAGTAEAVTLRLAGDGWTESGLTWNNRPATSTTLATLSGLSATNTAYARSVDPAGLAGLLGTTQSLALVGSGSDNLYVWSRNHSTASYRPQLVLTFS